MGYARYIGRVGALAVALGIGTAVASPAWAGAESTDNTVNSSEVRASGEESQPGGTAEPGSEDGAEGLVGPDVSGGDEEVEVEVEGEGEEIELEGEDELVDEEVELEGDEGEREGEGEGEGEDGPVLEQPVPESPSMPAPEDPPAELIVHNAGADNVDANNDGANNDDADDTGALLLQPEPALIAAKDRHEQLTPNVIAAEAPSLAEKSAAELAIVQSAVSAPAATVTIVKVNPPKATANPVRWIAVGLLRMFGYDPLATTPTTNPGPLTPVLDWIWAAYRRTESFFFNQSPTAGGAQVLATELAENGDVVVTGTLNYTDFNGDALSYKVTQGTGGVVSVDGNGLFTYTYTPTPGVAGADTFTITASDQGSFHLLGFLDMFKPGGGHTSTATVAIAIAATSSEGPTDPEEPSGSAFETTAPVSGAPAAGTGTVTGSFVVTDPTAGGIEAFVADVVGQHPKYGKVEVTVTPTGAAGTYTVAYTYTPDVIGRIAAYADGAQTDSFVVTVTDKTGASLRMVASAVPESAAPQDKQVLASVSVNPLPFAKLNESAGVHTGVLATAADGTLYQTVRSDDTLRVIVIRPDGSTTVSDSLGTGHVLNVLVGSGGTAFVLTTDDEGRYAVSVVDRAASVKTSETVQIDDFFGQVDTVALSGDTLFVVLDDSFPNENGKHVLIAHGDGTFGPVLHADYVKLQVGSDGLAYALMAAPNDTPRLYALGGAVPRLVYDGSVGEFVVVPGVGGGESYALAADGNKITKFTADGGVEVVHTFSSAGQFVTSFLGVQGGTVTAFLYSTGTLGFQNGTLALVKITADGAVETISVPTLSGYQLDTHGWLGTDGSAYLVYANTESDEFQTRIVRIAPDGTAGEPIDFRATGWDFASGQPVFGPNGAAYLAGGTGTSAADAKVSLLNLVNGEFSEPIDGTPVGSVFQGGVHVFFGPNGSAYIVNTPVTAADTIGELNVWRIDGAGTAKVLSVTSWISADDPISGLVFGPNGVGYLTTFGSTAGTSQVYAFAGNASGLQL